MGGLVGGVWRLLSGDREWLAETGAAQGVGRSAHPALSWGQVFLLLDAQLGDRDHATLACLGTVLSPKSPQPKQPCPALTTRARENLESPHPPGAPPALRSSALAPSIQYRALNLDWHLVSYMILYMFQRHSFPRGG